MVVRRFGSLASLLTSASARLRSSISPRTGLLPHHQHRKATHHRHRSGPGTSCVGCGVGPNSAVGRKILSALQSTAMVRGAALRGHGLGHLVLPWSGLPHHRQRALAVGAERQSRAGCETGPIRPVAMGTVWITWPASASSTDMVLLPHTEKTGASPHPGPSPKARRRA